MKRLILSMVAGLLLMASPAQANQQKFCDGIYQPTADCWGRELLAPMIAVSANAYSPTSVTVCAGARASNSDHNPYGHLICAPTRACHTYGGDNNLYGRVYVPQQGGKNFGVYGLAYWNRSPLSDCPAGTYRTDLYSVNRTSSASGSGATITPGLGKPAEKCLSIPDVDGFGITCASTSEANAKGLVATLQSDKPTDPITVALLPPAGTTSAVLTPSTGQPVSVKAAGGKMTAVVHRGAFSVRWTNGAKVGASLKMGSTS